MPQDTRPADGRWQRVTTEEIRTYSAAEGVYPPTVRLGADRNPSVFWFTLATGCIVTTRIPLDSNLRSAVQIESGESLIPKVKISIYILISRPPRVVAVLRNSNLRFARFKVIQQLTTRVQST